MVCFNEIFYFFFFNNYFGPYRIDLWPVLVCFGPNQTDLGPVSAVSDRIRLYRAESENQKKNIVWPQMRMHLRPWPHGVSLRIRLGCASPIGTPVLPRWTLILGLS